MTIAIEVRLRILQIWLLRLSSRLRITRRCINCSFLVPRQQRVYSLNELSRSILKILSSWIAPSSIMNGGILCVECYTLVQAHTSSKIIPPPAVGHRAVCFACGLSILRNRSYRVPLECPERKVILGMIPIHQGYEEPELLLVPKVIREMLILHNKFYVPTSARICCLHLDNGFWGELTSNLRDFTGTQFDDILGLLWRALKNST